MSQAGFTSYENYIYTLGIMISSLYVCGPFYILTSQDHFYSRGPIVIEMIQRPKLVVTLYVSSISYPSSQFFLNSNNHQNFPSSNIHSLQPELALEDFNIKPQIVFLYWCLLPMDYQFPQNQQLSIECPVLCILVKFGEHYGRSMLKQPSPHGQKRYRKRKRDKSAISPLGARFLKTNPSQQV